MLSYVKIIDFLSIGPNGLIQMLPFLLGIGLRTISIDSASIPAVQEAINRINIDEAEWQAREMLTFTRISEVEAYLAELRKG